MPFERIYSITTTKHLYIYVIYIINISLYLNMNVRMSSELWHGVAIATTLYIPKQQKRNMATLNILYKAFLPTQHVIGYLLLFS